MRSFLFAALFSVFASQVFALSIDYPVPGITGNITAAQFLAPNDPALAACSAECPLAINAVQACGTDDKCLCNATTTVPLILACEQCMFNQLIHDNRLPQDPRAGQSTAFAAYSAACSSISPIPATFGLVPPPDWDGPFGQGLTTFGTVVSVIAATVLGVGMITVVNIM
ncbi:hypothetical protein C2E23DRAFT_890756 [Lenzites betulinus]|nr:hypothetical protein C2E23DRAFT_890756 [Lenzites betulinus]